MLMDVLHNSFIHVRLSVCKQKYLDLLFIFLRLGVFERSFEIVYICSNSSLSV